MPYSQADLFADHPAALEEVAAPALEPPPAEFVARIRGELDATLRAVREAEALPWSDLTRATLAELRFHSIARWLPDEEASGLRAAFEAEMARLYEREDARPAG
jgi:hypothetical protein